jgi:hypothetical protein
MNIFLFAHPKRDNIVDCSHIETENHRRVNVQLIIEDVVFDSYFYQVKSPVCIH